MYNLPWNLIYFSWVKQSTDTCTYFKLANNQIHIYVQGVKGESGKCLSSKFGRNQCLYWNKRYISKKPLILALIWHPKSGRGIIRRAWRWLAVKELFLPHADLCFSRREGVAPSWYRRAHFQGAKLKLRSRAVCWCIVCFCTSNGSFRILKKAGGKFSKKIISAIS